MYPVQFSNSAMKVCLLYFLAAHIDMKFVRLMAVLINYCAMKNAYRLDHTICSCFVGFDDLWQQSTFCKNNAQSKVLRVRDNRLMKFSSTGVKEFPEYGFIRCSFKG